MGGKAAKNAPAAYGPYPGYPPYAAYGAYATNPYAAPAVPNTYGNAYYGAEWKKGKFVAPNAYTANLLDAADGKMDGKYFGAKIKTAKPGKGPAPAPHGAYPAAGYGYPAAGYGYPAAGYGYPAAGYGAYGSPAGYGYPFAPTYTAPTAFAAAAPTYVAPSVAQYAVPSTAYVSPVLGGLNPYSYATALTAPTYTAPMAASVVAPTYTAPMAFGDWSGFSPATYTAPAAFGDWSALSPATYSAPLGFGGDWSSLTSAALPSMYAAPVTSYSAAAPTYTSFGFPGLY